MKLCNGCGIREREKGRSKCKECRRKNQREYYLKNKEKILEDTKKRRKENPEWGRKAQRNWRKNNPEKIKEYNDKYKGQQKSRRKKIKVQWIEFIEKIIGKIQCVKCGYDKYFEALDFHHMEPTEKEINFASLITKSFLEERKKEVERELRKGVFLCATCHKEYHWVFDYYDYSRKINHRKDNLKMMEEFIDEVYGQYLKQLRELTIEKSREEVEKK